MDICGDIFLQDGSWEEHSRQKNDCGKMKLVLKSKRSQPMQTKISMKWKTFTVSLLVFAYASVKSQPPYPEAPEKWSKPVKVKELSAGTHAYAAEPTLTADGKALYYYYYSDGKDYGISMSVWQDSAWSSPVPLNGNINRDLAEGPSVSPDGKRLYFRMYGRSDGYGGWDLYYSDWNSLTRDWGPVKNLGPSINRADVDEWSAMTPDNKHLYWTRYPGSIRLSTWNDSDQTWGPSEDLRFLLGSYGRAAATLDRRKVYYDPFVETSNVSDIYVNYYDTLKNEWSYPMVLNLNKVMDTASSARGKIQQDPWISPDGKILYFTSDHDSSIDIWMSKLLIDENGIPVRVHGEAQASPDGFRLCQNYPNPFNPSTIIQYEIPSRGYVTMKVYDVLGREVAILLNEPKEPGRYEVSWSGRDKDGRRVSSGVYFYAIKIGKTQKTRKMIAVK